MTAMILLSEWQRSQVEFWLPTMVYGYDVSNFGRVRSWRTIKPVPNNGGTVSVRRKVPRIMRPHIPKAGYPIINLGRSVRNGFKGQHMAVHRLVALIFLPNPEGKPSVNHLTGLKTDARLDGLVWATWKEQSKHAWEFGLQKRNRHELAKKLNAGRRDYREVPDSMVRMIRNMLADGISQGQIRRWSGLKYTTIQSIAVGRTYRDVA